MSTPKIHYKFHDYSMAGAAAILEIVAPCLRDEEKREAHCLFYDTLMALLVKFDEDMCRMRRRIEPSIN